MDVRAGDRVVCIRENLSIYLGIVGKTYKVLDVRGEDGDIVVMKLEGIRKWVQTERFEVLPRYEAKF